MSDETKTEVKPFFIIYFENDQGWYEWKESNDIVFFATEDEAKDFADRKVLGNSDHTNHPIREYQISKR
tara:strand:- start:752 stop:958 length:207 start_codon:yes stop_codon:yes gene_type:complete